METIIEFLSTKRGHKGRRTNRMVRTISMLFAIMLILSSAAPGAASPQRAQGTSNRPDVWDLYVVDGPPLFYFMTDRSLRYKSDGTPCLVYGGDHLYYSCWDSVAGDWDTEMVDNGHMVGSYAALAFNLQDKPFITYHDALNGRLKMAYNLGFGWTIMIVDTPTLLASPSETEEVAQEVDPEADYVIDSMELIPWEALDVNAPTFDEGTIGVGKHTSIDIDFLNQVHISYYDEVNRALKYAFWNGIGLPQKEIVDDYHDQGAVGLWTSIQVDNIGQPQISYMDEKYDNLKHAVKHSFSNNWRLSTVDGGHNVGAYTSLVLDNNNRPHISYMDFSNYSLRYAFLNQDNQTWTVTTVDNSGSVGLFTSIARGANGGYHISYFDLANGDLRYARTSGGSWQITPLYTGGVVGLFTSLAMDSSNRASISFFNAGKAMLQFAYRDANNWHRRDVAFATDVGLATSLALSSIGVPHISYMDFPLGLMKYARSIGLSWDTSYVTRDISAGTFSSIKMIHDFKPAIAFYDIEEQDLLYAEWNGSNWIFDVVDETGDVGQYVSMAIDSMGNPHMSYLDATNRFLNYAYWDDVATEWMTDSIELDPQEVGGWTSIALDAFDRPLITYFDEVDEELKLAFKTPINAWANVLIDVLKVAGQEEPVDEAYNSIALDSFGTAFIAYYDQYYGNLRIASWDGASVTPYPAIDSIGDVGLYASLAIDQATNNRHICYYDATNKDLKYAFWDGVSWATSVVDSLGAVGEFCSLALDGLGRPGISYYDASMGDLKYAANYMLPPANVFIPVVITPP